MVPQNKGNHIPPNYRLSLGVVNGPGKGTPMSANYAWMKFYEAAVLETDPESLPSRIEVAQNAIGQRVITLAVDEAERGANRQDTQRARHSQTRTTFPTYLPSVPRCP